MQSLRLTNDEHNIKIEFVSSEMTGIEEVESTKVNDIFNDLDWRISTPETLKKARIEQDTNFNKSVKREFVESAGSLENSSSIFRRLQYISTEEPYCPQTFPFLDIGQSPKLLEKLVFKKQLNMVTVKLFPGDKPYSLCFVASGGKVIKESGHTVPQDYLMEYIDKQELPPSLAEEWDQIFPQLFYNGCVVVSLQDFRFSDAPVLRCTILKPHTQSIISDVNSLVSSKTDYTHREKLALESCLVNSIQGDLCLDPSVVTGIHRLNQHFCDYALHCTPLCKSVTKNNQHLRTKKNRLQSSSMPLFDFLSKKRVKQKESRAHVDEKYSLAKLTNSNSSSHISVNIIQDVSMPTRPYNTPTTIRETKSQLVENCTAKAEQKISSIEHAELNITQQRPHIGICGNIVCRC